jgi:hypothetical protein
VELGFRVHQHRLGALRFLPGTRRVDRAVRGRLRGTTHSALADRIAQSSLNLVAAHGFREYYDPIDSTGLGTDRFSWSAALALDWLADPQFRARLQPEA